MDASAWRAVSSIPISTDNILKIRNTYYVSVFDTIKKMGYEPAEGGGYVSWNDPVIGDFWTDGIHIFGPEILYKLSGKIIIKDRLWISLHELAYATYWNVGGDYARKNVSVERLVPTDIVINKTEQLGHLYGNDADGIRKEIRAFIVSTGASFGATPSRTYTLNPLTLTKQNKYYFTASACWIKWAVQLLGNVCIHTIYTTRQNELDTYGMRHGYEDLGRRASNGCIRMLFTDARLAWSFGKKISVSVIDGLKDDHLYDEIKTNLLAMKPLYEDYIYHMKIYE